MKKSIFTLFLFTCAVIGISLTVFHFFFPRAPERTWKDVILYVENSVTDADLSDIFYIFTYIDEISDPDTFNSAMESRNLFDWILDGQKFSNAFRYFLQSGEMSALDYVTLYTYASIAGVYQLVSFAVKWVADFFMFLTVS